MTFSKLRNFVLLLALVGGVSFFVSDKIQNSVLGYANMLRSNLVDDIFYLSELKKHHFNQVQTIKSLEEKINSLEKNAILSIAFASEINKINNNNKIYTQADIKISKALSYKNIGDFGQVWMDFKEFNPENIYGALYNGYTAGIVIADKGLPLALMQSDSECVFSVMIGDKKIPGIVFGHGRYMKIKFIPPWMEINELDEVSTSGLDNIFFEGIKVGRVMSVQSGELYKTAIIEPYAKINIPGYLYMVE